MAKSYIKDPDSTLDYSISWGRWLHGDTIVASSFDVPFGLVKEAEGITPNLQETVVWLSGGIIGAEYNVRNRITTALGRINDETIRIICVDR